MRVPGCNLVLLYRRGDTSDNRFDCKPKSIGTSSIENSQYYGDGTGNASRTTDTWLFGIFGDVGTIKGEGYYNRGRVSGAEKKDFVAYKV